MVFSRPNSTYRKPYADTTAVFILKQIAAITSSQSLLKFHYLILSIAQTFALNKTAQYTMYSTL